MGKKISGWQPPVEDEIVDTTEETPMKVWTPPAEDTVVEEPLKKKESTYRDTSVFAAPSVQDYKPSGQSTEKRQGTSTKVRNPLITLYRKGKETALYQIPSALVSSGAAGLGAVESTFKLPEQQLKGAGVSMPANYQEKAAKEVSDINQRINAGFAKLMQFSNEGKLTEENKQSFLSMLNQANERINFLNKNFNPSFDNSKIKQWQKGLVNWAIDRSQQGAEVSKDLVNKLSDIGDPLDAINWAVGAITESGVQIPAALATFGTSSIGQEIGSVYMDSINKIAQDRGITPAEVIERGLDSPAAALTYGSVAGIMDFLGAKGVTQTVSKGDLTKSLRQRTLQFLKEFGKGAIPESGTELSQTLLEQVGTGISSGKVDINYEELGEAAARAFVGGGAVSTIGNAFSSKPKTPSVQEIISQQKDVVNTDDLSSVATAAETIETKMKEESPVETGTQTQQENAQVIREDQGSVPQGREVTEGSQTDRGSDIQQGKVTEPGTESAEAQQQTQGEVNAQSEQITQQTTESVKPGVEPEPGTGTGPSTTTSETVQAERQTGEKPRYKIRGEIAEQQAEQQQSSTDTKSLFAQSAKLFYDVQNAEGATKKRSLSQKRRDFLKENPSIKYIDDNIQSIYAQLEKKGLLIKEGDCP